MNEMFTPFGMMQACWQMGAEMQKNWLSLWQQGLSAGMSNRAGLSGQPGMSGLPLSPWMLANPLAANPLAGMMPKVDAHITPLETRGPLAGAKNAARLSLRVAMPGCLGPAEMLLVEAVVARSSAEQAPLLKDIAPGLLAQTRD